MMDAGERETSESNNTSIAAQSIAFSYCALCRSEQEEKMGPRDNNICSSIRPSQGAAAAGTVAIKAPVSVLKKKSIGASSTNAAGSSDSTCPPRSAKQLHKRTARTRRRVHGLWNQKLRCCCLFSHLNDDLLFSMLSHLSMSELCIASMVCRRWKYLALHDQSWRRIDATEFVQEVHDCLIMGKQQHPERATERTSKVLASRIQRYKPLSLSIRCIQHRLSADIFLQSLNGLQELTLTGFSDLSDTHVHVMLLSSSCRDNKIRSSKGCELRKLVLDQCPLLTNATVSSVANLCPKLQKLSLRGNRNIKDILPLKKLWKVVRYPTTEIKPTTPATTETVADIAAAAAEKNVAASTLTVTRTTNIFMQSSFFTPPEKSSCMPQTQSLSSMFAPPTPPPQGTSSFSSTATTSSFFTPPPETPSLFATPQPPAAAAAAQSSLSSMFASPPPPVTTSVFASPPPPVTTSVFASAPPPVTTSVFASPPPPVTTSVFAPPTSSQSSFFTPPPPPPQGPQSSLFSPPRQVTSSSSFTTLQQSTPPETGLQSMFDAPGKATEPSPSSVFVASPQPPSFPTQPKLSPVPPSSFNVGPTGGNNGSVHDLFRHSSPPPPAMSEVKPKAALSSSINTDSGSLTSLFTPLLEGQQVSGQVLLSGTGSVGQFSVPPVSTHKRESSVGQVSLSSSSLSSTATHRTFGGIAHQLRGSSKTIIPLSKGRLKSIDVSNTGVSAESMLQSFQAASSAGYVRLEKLTMAGSGETWNDTLLNDLVDVLDLATCREVDIACSNPFRGATSVSNVGLESLTSHPTNTLEALEKINLAGHRSVSGPEIANIVSAANYLVDLDLNGCKGIGYPVTGNDSPDAAGGVRDGGADDTTAVKADASPAAPPVPSVATPGEASQQAAITSSTAVTADSANDNNNNSGSGFNDNIGSIDHFNNLNDLRVFSSLISGFGSGDTISSDKSTYSGGGGCSSSSFGGGGSNKSGGLQRLTMSRCFPTQKEIEALEPSVREQYDVCGEQLLDAICSGPSNRTLKELDLTGFWLLQKEEQQQDGRRSSSFVDKIRSSCPNLKTFYFSSS